MIVVCSSRVILSTFTGANQKLERVWRKARLKELNVNLITVQSNLPAHRNTPFVASKIRLNSKLNSEALEHSHSIAVKHSLFVDSVGNRFFELVGELNVLAFEDGHGIL